jgi:hypothetical protein
MAKTEVRRVVNTTTKAAPAMRSHGRTLERLIFRDIDTIGDIQASEKN